MFFFSTILQTFYLLLVLLFLWMLLLLLWVLKEDHWNIKGHWLTYIFYVDVFNIVSLNMPQLWVEKLVTMITLWSGKPSFIKIFLQYTPLQPSLLHHYNGWIITKSNTILYFIPFCSKPNPYNHFPTSLVAFLQFFKIFTQYNVWRKMIIINIDYGKPWLWLLIGAKFEYNRITTYHALIYVWWIAQILLIYLDFPRYQLRSFTVPRSTSTSDTFPH